MTRAATDGLFHECKNCRRENARRYCHVTWNEVLRNRRLTDEGFRLKELHRSLVHRVAIKRQFRAWFNYVDELGCNGQELHAWLTFQFDEGMTWRNYGKFDSWTLDHRIPLDKFDLTKAAERRIAFHWTNIQPCRDNFTKHTELRLYEVMNMVVSARRFLAFKSDMSRFLIVRDTLDWLKNKIVV